MSICSCVYTCAIVNSRLYCPFSYHPSTHTYTYRGWSLTPAQESCVSICFCFYTCAIINSQLYCPLSCHPPPHITNRGWSFCLYTCEIVNPLSLFLFLTLSLSLSHTHTHTNTHTRTHTRREWSSIPAQESYGVDPCRSVQRHNTQWLAQTAPGWHPQC